MQGLKVEKKPEKISSSPKREPSESHAHEIDYMGLEYQPPAKFAPLAVKFSRPANTIPRVQLFTKLQQAYGNRYVQQMVSAPRSQNVDEDESKLASEILFRKGSGKVLEPEVREFMEPRFGHDFSGVRIHTDSFATETSKQLDAKAFTVGRNVFFGSGFYRPSSVKGKEIIAHELTHVVQQGEGRVKREIAGDGVNHHEREARSKAGQVVQNSESASKAINKTLKGVSLGAAKIQRWGYGAGTCAADSAYQEVPNKDKYRDKVDKAMAKIEEVSKIQNCKDYFTKKGKVKAPADILKYIVVWEYPDKSVNGYSHVGDPNIAYTKGTYMVGASLIASILLHEIMHAGGQGDESICNMAPDECYLFTPYVRWEKDTITPSKVRIGKEITIQAIDIGESQGTHDHIEFSNVDSGKVVDAGQAKEWKYIYDKTLTPPPHIGQIKVCVPTGLVTGKVNVVIINNDVKSNPRQIEVE